MATTEFTRSSNLTVHKWVRALAVEAAKAQYFSKFMGVGFDAMIRVLRDLQKNAGDKITYGLRMKLSGDGIEGDNAIEGTSAEEALTFYSDYLYIDQRRKGTKSKGKMSEQRTLYNIRKEGMDALSVWWAEAYDEDIIIYLAGARGVDSSLITETTWTGRANNSLTSPDGDHQLYGGDATAKNNVDSSDVMSLEVIEKCISQAETTDPMIQPFMINGERKFVLLMHTWQQHQLRTNTSTGDWQDIHKNTDGKDSPIYKNALGEYADVILHKNRNVVRFSDYGSGSNLGAARALFLGAQAGTVAWGGTPLPGGKRDRFGWHEETDDRGNQLVITAGAIYGCKETTFNSKRFGMIAVDTYCANPNS